MKNRSFLQRLGFSLGGVSAAWRLEASFRSQAVMAGGAVAFLLWLRPPAVWWALVLMNCSLVLGAELFNTALEHTLDRLHPELHPSIRIAKDCAAGAVLMFSCCALGTFIALLVACWPLWPR
jgi:diacylglycerol kinase (ATP)